MAEHRGLDETEVAGGRGRSKDLGSVDSAESMPSQQQPLTINVGWLPQEQPMCPYCFTGLHVAKQNERGDTLFECLQPCVGDGYMAVYRIAGPRWEQAPPSIRPQVEGWKQPVRLKDIQAAHAEQKQAEPQEKPQGAWPEGEVAARAQGGDDKVEPRKAGRRRSKVGA